MHETEQLLRRYVADGSEAAFQELVARYINLVYSAAVRRTNGDPHRAQDIVQTVFTDLARKAAELPPNVMLGGWLHRHCCFVASSMARTEARRQAREIKAMNFVEAGGDESSSWSELAPVLDEAIQNLDEGDRNAITLRYFEGRNLRAVGEALGTSEDAAQKRVSRAIEKLRGLLTARGVALSAAALAGLMETNSVNAAPPAWAGRVSTKALEEVSPAGMLAAVAAFLFSGIGKSAAVLGIIALGIGGAIWAHRHQSAESAMVIKPAVSSGSAGTQPAVAVLPSEHGSNSVSNAFEKTPKISPNGFHLKVLSAETGEPIPNGPVEYRARTERNASRTDLSTDENGECIAVLPHERLMHVELTTRIPGYADTRLSWYPANGEKIPDSYTLRIEKGVVIGGSVLNERGEPVAGAKVGFNVNERGLRGSTIESQNFIWIETQTGSDGRWKIDRIGKKILKDIYGMATHPEYVPSKLVSLREDASAEHALEAQTHVFQLRGGMNLRGTVVDKDGNPVPNASVLAGNRGEVGSRETRTALDGTFDLKGVRPGPGMITAQAPQYAPATIQVSVETNTPPVEVVLSPGGILRLHVVGTRGEPIPRAYVWLDTRNAGPAGAGQPLVQADFSPKTDQDGRVFWDQAPPGPLAFSIEAKGYMRRNDIKVEADGQEHEIVLQNGLRIHGTVRDAEKNTPVPAFTMVTGWPNTAPLSDNVVPRWSDLDRFTLRFSGGAFDNTFNEPVIMGTASNLYVFKFTAPGYSPFISRVINGDERDVTLNVELTPASGQRIRVLQPNGQPAVRADIVFAAPLRPVMLGSGGFSRNGGAIDAVTDEQGETEAQPEENVVTIFAAHESGFAEVQPAALKNNPVIQLQQWGRVIGRCTKKGKPVTQRRMLLGRGNNMYDPSRAMLNLDLHPVTDDEGNFEFPKVPPIPWQIGYLAPMENEHSFRHVLLREIEVRPGETTTSDVAENGADVIARVLLPDGVTMEKADRIFSMVHTPAPMPPVAIRGNMEALNAWRSSPEIAAQYRTVKSWIMERTPEGTYKAENVPPGSYLVDITLGRAAKTSELFSAHLPLTVADGSSGETLDLGNIVLQGTSAAAGAGPAQP